MPGGTKKGDQDIPQGAAGLAGFPLQNGLSQRTGRPVQVAILADLLTITDPIWVSVVEGYLRRQKFYLLTEPEQYQEAARLFKRYSRKNRCCQYRVVNTQSILLLNKALEEYTFGKTKYRFKWSPTENAEMRKYYDMINSTRLDGGSIYDLLEPGVDLTDYEPLVKTLFHLISSEVTDLAKRQQVEANIQKYKSFQTNLRFDLVEVAPDGKEYPLSRIIGSKSGGERQTPFYVAILASLMKTFRINQNANSLRLVVFDEAFDKIDTSRIEECISMLREIGFQAIVAAPDHKASYIAPAVERT